MDVKVSIIIPHKNCQTFLGRLLNQIPDDPIYEIIVIDDLSDAPPEELISRKPNARLLNCPVDTMGAGAARNMGIPEARGIWLLFADADDQFTPEAFEIIQEHLHSDADIVYFPPTAVHDQPDRKPTRHLAYQRLVQQHAEADPTWIRCRFHPAWSKLVRRDLVEKHQLRFSENVASDDVLFSLCAGLAADSIKTDLRPIYCVTQGNSGSLTSRVERAVVESRFEVHCCYNDILRKKGLWRYRMTVLPVLKKAWTVSPAYALSLGFRSVFIRQPLYDNLSHMRDLWRRHRGLN